MYSRNSSPVLTDCLFSENSAGGGGGICSADDSTMALTNCTFIGNSASQKGGGLLNPEDCSLTLTNCGFINNTVTGGGGGIANGSSDTTLVGCLFIGNSAHDGQIPNVTQIILGSGGGMSAGGTPTLIRCTFRSNYATNGAGIIGGGELAECTFTGNSASEDGGAIHTIGEPIITNCTFSGNSANRGGGIFFTWGAMMTMANCTFAGNSASSGNALASDPHLPSLPGYFQLTNCILWDGENTIFDPDPYALRSAITHSNIQGGWPGEGNIDVDPDFVQVGYWTEPSPRNPNSSVWIEGDYHLKSETGRWDPNSQIWVVDYVTSLCIDAGDPNSPVGDEPDPNGGRINMGAYGGTVEASKSPGYSWWFETTQGPIPAEDLGIVLPHEHIFTDLRGPTTPGYGQADAVDVVRVMAPLLADAREKGVGVMFECSSIGVGRNVAIINQVAEASGLPVVVPTGVYGRANFAPPAHRNMSEDELTTLFVSEIRDGIEGTGIKAGFIKIATDEGPMNALIERILRAAGRAASETGAAIASHTPTGSNAVRQVDILHSIDPAIRFIWVHAQNESNRSLHVQLAARGAYIEFDSLGWNLGQDSTYIAAIKNLIATSHGNRILLSHDAGWYRPGETNGGTQKPYTYLIDTFIPKLRDAGVDNATIRMITETNPVRAFGFKSDE